MTLAAILMHDNDWEIAYQPKGATMFGGPLFPRDVKEAEAKIQDLESQKERVSAQEDESAEIQQMIDGIEDDIELMNGLFLPVLQAREQSVSALKTQNAELRARFRDLKAAEDKAQEEAAKLKAVAEAGAKGAIKEGMEKTAQDFAQKAAQAKADREAAEQALVANILKLREIGIDAPGDDQEDDKPLSPSISAGKIAKALEKTAVTAPEKAAEKGAAEETPVAEGEAKGTPVAATKTVAVPQAKLPTAPDSVKLPKAPEPQEEAGESKLSLPPADHDDGWV